jgi:hypothetical protein
MSFKSFVVVCRGAPLALRSVASPVRRESVPARLAGCMARVHALLAAPGAGVAAQGPGVPRALRARAFAIQQLAKTAAFAARAALRVSWTGRPLTPCGYAVLALVACVALAGVIAASHAGDEMDSALPLSWWFA